MDGELESSDHLIPILAGIIGACVPFAYGICTLYVLREQLPHGMGGCGLSAIGAVLLTAFGPPFGAILAGAAALCFGACMELWRNRHFELGEGVDQ